MLRPKNLRRPERAERPPASGVDPRAGQQFAGTPGDQCATAPAVIEHSSEGVGAATPVGPGSSSPSLLSVPLDNGGRMYGVAGWSPAGSSRRQVRSARQVEAEHRRRLLLERKGELEASSIEARERLLLPAGGEAGPMAGRSYRRLRVPAHRATSEVLAGAYPFLAEEGLGSAGILIGQDAWSGAAFCFDPWELYRQGQLTNPNMSLAGQIGRGKSTLAKSLAARCVAFGKRVYVPGDPKGEWTVVARALGGAAIELGVGTANRLNPLDEGPRPSSVDDATWRARVDARRTGLVGALGESTLGRPLGPTERSALDAALADAQARAGVPILPMVVDALLDPQRPCPGSSIDQLFADGREVGHALARLVRGDLGGLFDGPSTISFDPSAPMLTLDLSAISGSDTLIGLVMTCASTWMEAALADPGGGQRLVVYDEAWRLLAQPALLARMQAQWKLSRAWGLANLMIVHRLSDLDAVGDTGSQSRGLAQGLLGDTATRILYNEPYDEAQAAGRILGLTSVEVAQLPELAKGEGLWRVNERAFVVRHLCTPGELAVFDTDARMVDKPKH